MLLLTRCRNNTTLLAEFYYFVPACVFDTKWYFVYQTSPEYVVVCSSATSTACNNEQFIAQGTFCAVFACEHQGLSVVAKRVREDLPLSERRAALVNLWGEFECLRRLSHPNVIEAYGMW